MATGADANNLRMINGVTGNWCPGLWWHTVTRLALVAGIDVIDRFARCYHSVMATVASANDLTMINSTGCYRNPGRG